MFHIAVLTVSILAALAVGLLFAFPRAYAEERSEVSLIPIETDTSVTYRVFDSPNSLYADSVGILVAGRYSIEYVSGENKVTSSKRISADKVYRKIAGEEGAEYLVVLYNGKLYSYGDGDGGTELTVDGATGVINDFCVEDGTLYAVTATELIILELGDAAIDEFAPTVVPFTSDYHVRINATTVAAAGGQVLVAVDSMYVRKQDVCFVNSGALSLAITQTDPILSMSASAGALYTLTRSDLTRYGLDGGVLHAGAHTDGTPFASLFAYGDCVYALDTLNGLHKLSASLGTDETLIASSSDVLGFFNMPSDLAAKSSVLYVADTLNGRIVTYGDDVGSPTRLFNNPVSVAADSAGTVYVAHDFGKVSAFSSPDLSDKSETVIVDGELGYVKQIAVDSDKNLYILASGGLYKVSPGGSPQQFDKGLYKTITLGVGRDQLYALSDSEIVAFDTDGKASVKRPAPKNAVALSADMSGTVFVLTTTGIVRIAIDSPTVEFTLTEGGKPYTLGSRNGKMLLCSVQNKFVSHGDMIVLDTYKHRMYKVSGDLGARFVDKNFKVPVVSGATSPAAPQDGLIRTVIRDTQVYALPMESAPIFSIAASHKVIVPYYELSDTHEYSLILIDDTVNNVLVQGYVYRDALSAPLDYVAPPNDICTIFSEVTPIYKWPSRFAKAVDGHAAVNKNTKFEMLSFVDGYKDDFGRYWYRIKLEDGSEGYIPAVNISTIDYAKQNILPEYNAEIISYNGSEAAPTFKLENGKYVQIEGVMLKTGTKVEVVGAYDSSEYYTQIKYLDEITRQTVTCYVQTVYIKYNGMNIVLIVAVIVIIVTVMLAAIIITRTLRSKKKRLEKENLKEKEKEKEKEQEAKE